ncbi:MAG: glycosyltransferase family 4 protein [Gammaproteobacteria bacterium]|nr:glycosyltransferase family 4 protein [Gammaproteobacteria bacterium]
MKRPRILHLEAGRHLHGGALQVKYLLEGLRGGEFENVLVCAKDSAIAQAAGGLVDRCYPVPIHGDFDPAFLYRLVRIIHREHPDLVHLHSRRAAELVGGLAAQMHHARVLLTRRVDNPESAWFAPLKYRLYDKVVTISEAIRNMLTDRGIAPEKISCVHSAVNAEHYTRRCDDTSALHRAFGIPPGRKVVAVIAQLIPRKGHHHLLAALPEILERAPDTHFLFLGRGPLKGNITDQLTRSGLSSHVTLGGFRDDLDAWFGCLDLVVHPAEMEGLGVSLLQASAAGVPIVAFAAGGIPEVVRDRVNGRLLAVGDIPGLRDAVVELLTDDDLARRYGEAGRALVREEFSVEAMVQGNIAVYREMLTD